MTMRETYMQVSYAEQERRIYVLAPPAITGSQNSVQSGRRGECSDNLYTYTKMRAIHTMSASRSVLSEFTFLRCIEFSRLGERILLQKEQLDKAETKKQMLVP